jgi:glucose uptake protein GlcU
MFTPTNPMTARTLVLSGITAGLFAAVANLVVERALNHTLVSADYITSAVLFVLTSLVIIFLFRNRSSS